MSSFDYIINPTNGRKVNVKTRLGRNIIEKYKNITQRGGLKLPFKKKPKENKINEVAIAVSGKENEVAIAVSGKENEIVKETTPKKSLVKKIRQGARKKIANIQNKAAEFERNSPTSAKILKMATKGIVKTTLGVIPGGKLIASGTAAVGKIASQQIYKRSPAARNQWWKHHLSSGNWQRNKDKAVLEFDLLDHDDSGTINEKEYLLSIEGMYHPDSSEAQLLKDVIKERKERGKKGKTVIQSHDEINSALKNTEIVVNSPTEQHVDNKKQHAGGKKRVKLVKKSKIGKKY